MRHPSRTRSPWSARQVLAGWSNGHIESGGIADDAPQEAAAPNLEDKMLTENMDVTYRVTRSPLVDLFYDLEDTISGPSARDGLKAAWKIWSPQNPQNHPQLTVHSPGEGVSFNLLQSCWLACTEPSSHVNCQLALAESASHRRESSESW